MAWNKAILICSIIGLVLACPHGIVALFLAPVGIVVSVFDLLILAGYILAIMGVAPRFRKQRNGLLLGASVCLLIAYGISVVYLIGLVIMSALMSFASAVSVVTDVPDIAAEQIAILIILMIVTTILLIIRSCFDIVVGVYCACAACNGCPLRKQIESEESEKVPIRKI